MEDNAPLCSTCSALDLRAILYNGIPKERAVLLGRLTDILNKYNQCGLCRLVAIAIRRMWKLDKHPGIDLTGITCTLYARECGLPEVQKNGSPVLRNVCHRLYIDTSDRPRDVTNAIMAAQLHLLLEIQLLEEDASKVGRTKELHGRRVGQNVDMSLLKRWIHICGNEHREKCETVWWRGPGDVLPKSVRVVDVAHMAICPAPPKCRYVALSYIWGGPGDAYWTTKANLQERSKAGGLDASAMPGTISDTIQLVRQLGERYLWIDALCIVQDDPDDKGVQIGVMELIYGSSALTIFAAGGTSARDPLPGFRPGSRDIQQQITKIQGLHLAVPLGYPRGAVASTAWNERGWTYQEVMLSRRRIFFTGNQMHFECGTEVWTEDVIAEPIKPPLAAHPLKLNGVGKFTPMSPPSRWESDTYLDHYTIVINKYTQRKLTVESDIVNAVMALLHALTKGYNIAGGNIEKAFRFGMPLVDLERALLWQPVASAPHSRRVFGDGNIARWPSWSWAAWRGGARYTGLGVFSDVQSSQGATPFIYRSLVEEWFIVDDNGQVARLDVRRFQDGGKSTETGTYVAPKGDIDQRQLITKNAALRPGTLIFRTSCARFEVKKADDVAKADPEANYDIYSIISSFPRPSTLVGRVVLPRSAHPHTWCEFVVLARGGQREGLYDKDALGKSYTGCMLNVMGVEKMEEDENVVERVGVGVIFEQAWTKSDLETRNVLLW